MSDVQEKCAVCQALIDEEDLFCSNCGAAAPHLEATAAATQVTTHVFKCRGCGAAMSFDAQAQTLRCPFCGSGELDKEQDQLSIKPRFLIQARVVQDQAMQSLRKWLGSSFWRPSDLVSTAVVQNIRLVYVPFWVFRAQTFTYWTADSSSTPAGARGDWYPLTGQHRSVYEGLLVGASSILSTQEIRSVEPYDFSEAIDATKVPSDEILYEQFRVPRKYARPYAKSGFESWEAQACQKYVPGSCRNMKVNTRFEGLSSEPVLLPCWIMAYNYKHQVYRFLINAQTGRSTGTAPISTWKIVAVVVAVVALLALSIALGSLVH